MSNEPFKKRIQTIEIALSENANRRAMSKDIFEASKKSRIDDVKIFIKDVNKKDENDETPIMFAAYYGDLEIVKLLVEKNAEINARNNDDFDALSMAIFKGHLRIVEYLISKGVDIHTSNKSGWTPVMFASGFGEKNILSLLLKHGAEINLQITGKEFKGFTALMLACTDGYLEIVKLLLEAGADPNIRNKKDRTALDIAIKKKREEIVKIFKMKGIHEQGIREDLNDLEELDDLEDKIINFKL